MPSPERTTKSMLFPTLLATATIAALMCRWSPVPPAQLVHADDGPSQTNDVPTERRPWTNPTSPITLTPQGTIAFCNIEAEQYSWVALDRSFNPTLIRSNGPQAVIDASNGGVVICTVLKDGLIAQYVAKVGNDPLPPPDPGPTPDPDPDPPTDKYELAIYNLTRNAPHNETLSDLYKQTATMIGAGALRDIRSAGTHLNASIVREIPDYMDHYSEWNKEYSRIVVSEQPDLRTLATLFQKFSKGLIHE